ncbi:MAG: hypothetical protein ATN35_04065 [Epulopiscium sp. Nele67-Bin004]|nr:MAG: hypothetical protein ATN35_04065 [Epulopiscium sp. Nele67-Bin004]
MLYELAMSIVTNLYYVVFDVVFLVIAILVVFIYKRENDKWEMTGIKDVVRGTLLGVVLSSIMSVSGITIPLTVGMMFLIPLTVLLTSVNPKWGCFAYVIPFAYIINQVFEVFGYNVEMFKFPYPHFITLIGFLHLVEGILVMLWGHENTVEVPIYDGRGIIKGQLMKKFWPVPLVIFTGATGAVVPLYAVLGYIDVAKHFAPKEKAQRMGSIIFVYGLALSWTLQHPMTQILHNTEAQKSARNSNSATGIDGCGCVRPLCAVLRISY